MRDRDKLVITFFTGMINSNVSLKKDTPENRQKVAKFIRGLKRIFLSSNILNLIEILPNEERGEDDRSIPKPDLLGSVESVASVEIGSERGFVHVHYSISVVHFTTLYLNTNTIMKMFKEFEGISVLSGPPKLKNESLSKINHLRYVEKEKTKKRRLLITGRIENLDELEWLNEEAIQTYSRKY